MHRFTSRLISALFLMILLASSLFAQDFKPSLPANYLSELMSFKDEASLRKETMWRLTEIAIRHPRTSFGMEARQAVRADRDRTDPHAWIADTLKVVGSALRNYPPTDENWEIRREALMLLDLPLHVEAGDELHRGVEQFFKPFLDNALKEIKATKVKEGVRIWHIYNMGFVVKTRSHTVAFDIFSSDPREEFLWINLLNKEQTGELAKVVDVAFLSHWHLDHVSLDFLTAMSAEGKRVYIPTPIDPLFSLFVSNMSCLTPVRSTPENAPITEDGIKIYSYPGFQGSMPCNVYVLDMDGYTISQNGDNKVFDIYGDIAKSHKIDVALANTWSGMNEFVEMTGAKFIVSGHENEMHHAVRTRVPYQNTYANLDNLELAPPWKPGGQKVSILSNGESITWPR